MTTESLNRTVVTDTSGKIVDFAGNVWTITTGAQVAVNGVADQSTSDVVELAYVDGVIWRENSFGSWWHKYTPDDTWAPPNGTTTNPLQTTSSSGTQLQSIPVVSSFPPASDFDYHSTIISQYANAATLVTLIGAADQWINPTTNFANFFAEIWNVDTAQGIGLDIWGRIVGITRVLQVSTSDYFGFEEAQLSASPFDVAPFYTGQQTTNNFVLSDNSFRTLIFAKALANICDGSIPAINQILLYLFPKRGNCYVKDNLDMTMSYVFDFELTPVEVTIIQQSGVLPKPTGVTVNFVEKTDYKSAVWDNFSWNDGSLWS